MTLGELIKALEQVDPALPIDGDGLDSYRGYYDQLAVIPGESTVGHMLGLCRAAVGKTFTGYKGGDFVMRESTAVWFSEWGECSRLGVVGVSLGADSARFHVVDVSAYG